MLQDITKIEILGAKFDVNTMFEIFKPQQANNIAKGALLYGRNGSGKSTIAKAFRKISGESDEIIKCAKVYNENDEVELTENEKKHIFVFDEDYIDNNVKFQEDHLETIIMLGSTVDLAERIKTVQTELFDIKVEYERQEEKYRQYCDNKNILSPKYYLEKMVNALRGDDNWAGRERRINNSRSNSPVNPDTYKKFVALSPTEKKNVLLQKFEEKIEKLNEVRSGVETIKIGVPLLLNSYLTIDGKSVSNLLGKKIEKPELSEREKKLFSLLENHSIEVIDERLRYFQDENNNECPYCFQSISPEYKDSLVLSIEKVLSQTVEDHQKELKKNLLNPINIELSSYINLNGYQECVDNLEKANDAIKKYNELIHSKIQNPYHPIEEDIFVVSSSFNKLNNALKILEIERNEYNKGIISTQPLINELKKINNEIAFYDIQENYYSYNMQEKTKSQEKKILDDLKNKLHDKKEELENLIAQKKNVKLAIDSINASLTYIFFAENRLKIDYENGVYKLLSHGKNVKPCDISVGERNIIGLSYFFTNILEGKEVNKAYNEEYLIILDDPISSYDIENRIGILSFLKYQISLFLEGNKTSKVLVMTHDLKTFYDFQKIFEETIESYKEIYKAKTKANIYLCEICNNELVEFKYKQRNEYTQLIQIIYKYAKGEANDYEPVIGNIMRQVLEAFSTFEYKKAIDKVSTDKKILELLPKEYRVYFSNLMYRLVLHGGSHKEEQIKTMNDYSFFKTVSEKEKMRTASDILCLLYLLNKRHLLEHLGEEGNKLSDLKKWCNEIKKKTCTQILSK